MPEGGGGGVEVTEHSQPKGRWGKRAVQIFYLDWTLPVLEVLMISSFPHSLQMSLDACRFVGCQGRRERRRQSKADHGNLYPINKSPASESYYNTANKRTYTLNFSIILLLYSRFLHILWWGWYETEYWRTYRWTTHSPHHEESYRSSTNSL